MSLDHEVIKEIAVGLAIGPAFVEKDWYSVQVLKKVTECPAEVITTIFSGGTSLSKGYGLIQRFSEDLDFRCCYNNIEDSKSQKNKIRSTYKERIVTGITDVDSITVDKKRLSAVVPTLNFL